MSGIEMFLLGAVTGITMATFVFSVLIDLIVGKLK